MAEINQDIELDFLEKRSIRLQKAILQMKVDISSAKARVDDIEHLLQMASKEYDEISGKILRIRAGLEEAGKSA